MHLGKGCNMAEKKVQVKKKRKLKTRGLLIRLVSILLLVVSGFLIYGIVTEVSETIALSQELEIAKEKLAEIQAENQYLVEQKEKLEDPEYIKNYERGEYFYTKEGEQVFRLPQLEDSE